MKGPRRYGGARRLQTLIAVAAIMIGGCGDDDESGTATPTPPTFESFADRQPPPELAEGCAAFEAAYETWLTSSAAPNDDLRFADELARIARTEAAGTALEPPLHEMASEFRSGQLNIDSGTITELCAGNMPLQPSAEDRAAQEAFLARVRGDAPTLGQIADDDLLAAADQVCSSLELGLRAESDRQAYFILTGIANTAMGHDNEDETPPLIRAAVDTFCPRHAESVNRILATA